MYYNRYRMGYWRKKEDREREEARESKNGNQKRIVSRNADNRIYCIACGKEKFCYDSEKKALLACKYSPNDQRAYYCYTCHAWHTSHIMDKSELRRRRGYHKKWDFLNREKEDGQSE